MLMRHAITLILCGTFLATPAAAQEPDHSAHSPALVLGSVNFRNSGNRAAQAPLQRGVAWLHNFKYKEAADAFREAQRADQSLAIASTCGPICSRSIVISAMPCCTSG